MSKFNALFPIENIWVYVNPYKPYNHNLYIGIIIFLHIDNTIYKLQSTEEQMNKKEPQKK